MTTLIKKETDTENSVKEIASVVKRLGNPVSTILLDAPCYAFQIGEIDGIIGYQLVRNCAVVLGDPICLPENTGKLTHAFHLHCQKHNLRIIYFLVSNSFAYWAINNGCNTLIETGEELIIDPTQHQKKQKLRWKIKQSIKQGVVIKEYKDFDPTIENQIRDLTNTWLKEKHGPQIYLGDLNYVTAADKRIFYAIQDKKIIGLLKLSPIDRFQGWVLSTSLTISDAPVGTSEYLMSFVLETLARENCHFLCLGAVSGAKLGDIIGLSIFAKFIAHLIFRITNKLFKLDARKVYLSKYQPCLLPRYVLISGKITFMDLMALKEVLNVRLCFQ